MDTRTMDDHAAARLENYACTGEMIQEFTAEQEKKLERARAEYRRSLAEVGDAVARRALKDAVANVEMVKDAIQCSDRADEMVAGLEAELGRLADAAEALAACSRKDGGQPALRAAGGM